MRRLLVLIALAAYGACAAAEPIRWADGTWDDSGAPKGKLLSDNHHWYGARIFTGMTYSYETPPTSPKDIRGHNPNRFGKRLQGGRNWIRDTSFVGREGDRPIVAVFDFKRPCTFNEVDLFSPFCTNAAGSVEFSGDGKTWVGKTEFVTTSAYTRVRFGTSGCGQRLRLSFKARPGARCEWRDQPVRGCSCLRERCAWEDDPEPGHTYLNEVFVWGDGEVSDRYPEAIEPLAAGSSRAFTNTAPGVVSILPMPMPRIDRKPTGSTPARFALKMARNETESRYFAVVNGGAKTEILRLETPDFGDGLRAELLIGGIARRSPPKRRLSDAEMVMMATTNREGINADKVEDLDFLPFFFADAIPSENYLRKFLANPRQVAGFPGAVELAPGEGCVVMLRITSSGARLGSRSGTLRAGKVALPIDLSVVDLTLPPQSMWIYAYEPFTQQHPFESAARVRRDTERYVGVGATTTKYLPEDGTKEQLFFRQVPNATVGLYPWIDRRVYPRLLKGEFDALGEPERQLILRNATAFMGRAKELGLQHGRLILFLPDEPKPVNARSTMKLAEFLKKAFPDVLLHCDPLMFEGGGKGFLPDKDILEAFLPEYNRHVDVSCPISFIAASRPKLMKALWTAPRRINAQYNHPAGRMGREAAYQGYRDGFNGHAYYCYHDDLERFDPWDASTWEISDCNYQAVYPLENDVAITALYETLREAAEDFRMLDALKAAGKADVLKEVLSRADAAWDRTRYAYRHLDPKAPDILDLRERILSEF